MKILVINAGSSSLKYQLIDMETEHVLAKGLCERIGLDGHLKHTPLVGGKPVFDEDLPMPTHSEAIAAVIDKLTSAEYGVVASMKEIDAVGHRVVHGGEKFACSVKIDDAVMAALEECTPFAPLHNPANITGINACTAEEAELKLNETYHKPVRGYELEEMIHGPHYALDESNYTFFVAPDGPGIERVPSFLAWYEENRVTEHVFVITNGDHAGEFGERSICFEGQIAPELTPLVMVIPLLFWYVIV